jgi:hypothetical protein
MLEGQSYSQSRARIIRPSISATLDCRDALGFSGPAKINFGAERVLPQGMSIVSVATHELPNLSEVFSAIQQKKDVLLQPTLESMQASYKKGLASVLLDGERTVGYVRFSTLLDDDLKTKLNLESSVPNVYEIGTAIILPEYRGNGFYPQLRNNLLSLVEDQMKTGELLVIGTTKSVRVAEVMKEARKMGINFSITRPGEYPGIQCLTCVCKPDFGVGVQFDVYECPKTMEEGKLINLRNIAELDGKTHHREILQFSPDGKIDCVMYVSDVNLAQRTSDKLIGVFGSKQNFVKAITKAEPTYYE